MDQEQKTEKEEARAQAPTRGAETESASMEHNERTSLLLWMRFGFLVSMCTYGVLCECIIYKQDSVCRRRPTMARRCLCGAA